MNYRGYPILEPHYNIAPTSILPILTLDDGHRHISPMKWGLTLVALVRLQDWIAAIVNRLHVKLRRDGFEVGSRQCDSSAHPSTLATIIFSPRSPS